MDGNCTQRADVFSRIELPDTVIIPHQTAAVLLPKHSKTYLVKLQHAFRDRSIEE